MKKSIVKKSSKKKSLAKKASAPRQPVKSAKRPAIDANWLESRPHYRQMIDGVDTIVLGTAHVSKESVADVQTLYERLQPAAVAIELCQGRYDAMMDKDRWRKLDLAEVIRNKKIWLLVSSLILSAFQKKIGETTGSKPGEEMMVAGQLAQQGQSRIVLADREIRTTLSRAWARVGFFHRMWLASYLLASLLVSEDIDEEQIEELKQKDVLEDMLSALPKRFAHIKEVIIDERDQFLAENIRQASQELATEKKKASQKSLLAVVGAGHLPGIRRVLSQNEAVDLDELATAPAKSNWGTIISIVAFLAIMAGFSWIGFIRGSEALADMALLWILGRSLGAGLGTLIAGARPLTILVTVIVAPFAYFIGFLGFRLWMLTALMELKYRKPRVEDFENIAGDTETFAQFRHALYHNRVIHIIFLIMATGMGLTLGNLPFFVSYLGILWDMGLKALGL
ncbi:MAG: TraB/GumN family protein [Leptospiraceae bacterium]|nr:TraB/GumN family protein [Leptospiraceae bacterium]